MPRAKPGGPGPKAVSTPAIEAPDLFAKGLGQFGG